MAGKLAKFFGAQDMTQGKPITGLVRFSAPLLMGNLAQQLYSTVDSIVVGRYVGDNALAAVGVSMPFFNLILVFFVGISTGCTIMVSQYFGAKQKENLSYSVGTSLTSILLISLVLMFVGPLITRPTLTLLNTPPEIFDMALSYVNILFYGILGVSFYNLISSILRGLGDSIMPLIYLLITCGLNIVLDILFVAYFDMGVAGAAVATIVSQFFSSVLCIIRLLRMTDVMSINKKTLTPKKEFVSRLIKLGLPSGLTQAVFSLATIVVQSLTNSFGASVVAVNTVIMRVDGFAMMPNFTFGVAMTTFTGQNIGAGKMKRVDQGAKDGMKLGMLVSSVLVVCILLFGVHLIRMFTSTPEVISLGLLGLRILAVGYVAMAVTQILSGIMRGAGDTIIPMWISIITTVVIRVPLAYGIAYFTRTPALPTGSPLCIFISLLISWVLGGLLTIVFYRRGKWRGKAITGGVPATAD